MHLGGASPSWLRDQRLATAVYLAQSPPPASIASVLSPDSLETKDTVGIPGDVCVTSGI